jgi:hypothetical protein
MHGMQQAFSVLIDTHKAVEKSDALTEQGQNVAAALHLTC